MNPASPQPPDPASPVSPIEVDARGLRCPLPVIRLAEAARDAPMGASIVVLATDSAARYDIAAWCRMRGHELHEMTEVGDLIELSGATGATRVAGEVTGGAEPPDSSGADIRAHGHSRAYLRFVVRLAS